MKYVFRPEVIVDGDTFPKARNKLLHVLAAAEVDGKVYYFTLSHEERRKP